MTKEEFKEKLNDVVDFDFEKNEPKYAGSSAPLEDIIEIQKEYIESLEKETEYLNNENHTLSRKIEELKMEFKLWKERYL